MDVIQGLDSITVHLTQANAEKAREFYSRVLGLKELSWDDSQGRGAWQIPHGDEPPPAERARPPPRAGCVLVAHVMQPDEPGRPPGTVTGILFAARDAHASAEEVRRRGGRVVDEPWKAPWGPVYVTVADPDGNEFVLVQR